ncbi:hypothetical protein [Hymenobacter sp. 102]|uniref:hypothetical protein n=1 Tax=Hymenobacter sp. 102 TaxID=3403152 RepID=UPI003CF897BC
MSVGLITSLAYGQQTLPPARLGLQVHYGGSANFFAASFRDTPSELQHVRLLGTAGGAEVSYRVGRTGAVALGYTRTVNSDYKQIPYETAWGSTPTVDVRLRYVNNAFQAVYEREVARNLRVHAGLLYMTTASQTASYQGYTAYGAPVFALNETSMRNSYPEEAGVVAGLEYSRPIDTHFRLGLKARGYYLASVATFEMLTPTPTPTYSW